MVRPHVVLNAAMTLDGKIATVGGDSGISCPEDLDRVHKLRASVDAVMVGAGTVLADNPSLTVRRARGKNPTRVVVDGLARIPTDARVMDRSAPTIIAASKRAPKSKLDALRSAGAEVIVIGERKVDLRKLLEMLRERGVKKLLLEGGSTLNWEMLKQGLVDEIRVAISPRVVGGAEARTLVGGEGFRKVGEGIKLELLETRKVGRDLVLRYKVMRCSGQSVA